MEKVRCSSYADRKEEIKRLTDAYSVCKMLLKWAYTERSRIMPDALICAIERQFPEWTEDHK